MLEQVLMHNNRVGTIFSSYLFSPLHLSLLLSPYFLFLLLSYFTFAPLLLIVHLLDNAYRLYMQGNIWVYIRPN